MALSRMIDLAMAFADTGKEILISAMLAECQDCAKVALAATAPRAL